MDPQIPPEGATVLLEQIMSLWVNPEIERRKEAGGIDEAFTFRAAQVIMHTDRPNEIRLNNEVAGALEVKLRVGRGVNVGDPIYENDVEAIERIELLSSEDPNAAHITVLHLASTWFIGWDCRYHADHAREHLDAAREFINVARDALSRGESRALAQTLFDAAELCVKARMILMPRRDILESTRHGVIRGEFGKFARLNVDERPYAKLLNRLEKMRASARFLRSEHSLSVDDQAELLRLTESLHERVMSMLPSRRELPDGSDGE